MYNFKSLEVTPYNTDYSHRGFPINFSLLIFEKIYVPPWVVTLTQVVTSDNLGLTQVIIMALLTQVVTFCPK